MIPPTSSLRILLVSNYFPEHIGGVETVADNLARGYRSRGHRVWWAAAQPSDSIHRGPSDDLALAAWNITEKHFGFPYPILHPAGIARLIQAVKRSDVVHVHDCLYPASVIAVIAAKNQHKPVLLTQHVGEVPYRQPALRVLQHLAYRGLGRFVLGQADQISFISQPVARWFASFVPHARSAPVIGNGVDTTLFRPAAAEQRQAVRTELGLPTNGVVLLFCGRFVQKKGLHLLRDVAQRNPQWSLILIGRPGDTDPAAWHLPNVHVLGPMGAARLASYYQAGDVLVMPSTGEGFPVTVQEAMASGTPAVISDELQPPIPLPGAFGTARTAVAIEAAIARALQVPEEQPGFKERVATFAREHWDWDASVARYEELLTALLAQQPGRPREAVA